MVKRLELWLLILSFSLIVFKTRLTIWEIFIFIYFNIVCTLFTSQPARMHSSMNWAQPGVWHAFSNIVNDVSISFFSTSVGECKARRNDSISRLDNAFARLYRNQTKCSNKQILISLSSRYFVLSKITMKGFIIQHFKVDLPAGHRSTLMDVPPFLYERVCDRICLNETKLHIS